MPVWGPVTKIMPLYTKAQDSCTGGSFLQATCCQWPSVPGALDQSDLRSVMWATHLHEFSGHKYTSLWKSHDEFQILLEFFQDTAFWETQNQTFYFPIGVLYLLLTSVCGREKSWSSAGLTWQEEQKQEHQVPVEPRKTINDGSVWALEAMIKGNVKRLVDRKGKWICTHGRKKRKKEEKEGRRKEEMKGGNERRECREGEEERKNKGMEWREGMKRGKRGKGITWRKEWRKERKVEKKGGKE